MGWGNTIHSPSEVANLPAWFASGEIAVAIVDARSVTSEECLALHETGLGQLVILKSLREQDRFPDTIPSIGIPVHKRDLAATLVHLTHPESAQLDTRTQYGLTAQATMRARILVVEDNAINQRYADVLLRRLGHAVDFAGNGREAVASLQRSRYDLVLMDCVCRKWMVTKRLLQYALTRQQTVNPAHRLLR